MWPGNPQEKIKKPKRSDDCFKTSYILLNFPAPSLALVVFRVLVLRWLFHTRGELSGTLFSLPCSSLLSPLKPISIYLNRFKEMCIFISLQARVNGTTLYNFGLPSCTVLGPPWDAFGRAPAFAGLTVKIKGDWPMMRWMAPCEAYTHGTCVWSRWGQCQANSGCAIFLTTAGTNSSRGGNAGDGHPKLGNGSEIPTCKSHHIIDEVLKHDSSLRILAAISLHPES